MPLDRIHRTSIPRGRHNCSSINFIWGRNLATASPHLAVYSCLDHVDELLVDVTLSYPSLQLVGRPIPIESTVKPTLRIWSPS